ncbi:sensor histidine kinase [Pseudaestuariivita sp.]|uniref:sensor histidine kinase n=1 Tax=Pseudaestuariivita sp. TaxID=2211669 RepID=UPI00405A08D5
MRALFLLITLLWAQAAAGSTPCGEVALEPDAAFRADLGPFACVLADDSGSVRLDHVTGEGGAELEPVPGGLVDFGFGTARYWVRVDLRNASTAPGLWWVTHDLPSAKMLRVRLVPEGAAPRTLLSLEEGAPFTARPIAHRHLVSEVALAAGQRASLVIDYETGQATEMPLTIEAVPSFVARTQTETVRIIAVIALALGIGLINTLYLYGFDGRPAIAYGGYVATSVLLLVHMDGFGFQHLYPNWPAFNDVGVAVIGLASIALGTLFLDVFTEAHRHSPRLHAASLTLAAALVGLAALSVPYLETVSYKLAGLIGAALLTGLQLWLIGAAIRRGQAGAWLLLLGFGALSAGIMVGVLGYLTEGLFEQEWAGTAIRAGFAMEAAAFSAAIALRIRAARRERSRLLREKLRASEERLRLSEALRRAEEDRSRAADAARRSSEALANAAHDIRQPLTSLQMALRGSAETEADIAGSLDYIEGIVRDGLEAGAHPLGTGDANPAPQAAAEVFAASVVLRNVAAMFDADAAARDTRLQVIPCDALLCADPLAVMRILSNLVSNALTHANASRVLVGCRSRGPQLRFEVHDDGVGMAPELLAARGARGPASEGYGLGLTIVEELAVARGFAFSIRSAPGEGTVTTLAVPRAVPEARAAS